MQPPRVVKPSEHAEFFEPMLRRLQTTFGCILAVDEQGRSVTKGTVVFVSVGPQKMLVTARHVVRSRRLRRHRLLLMLPRVAPGGVAVKGKQTVPVILPLASDMLWESKPLDVAFIRPPDRLAAMAEARFFDGAYHAEVATKLRERWHRECDAGANPWPYFVLGFPNFGHLIENLERRVETLSSVALPAYVTQFEPHPWEGHGNLAPQLSVEVDAGEDGLPALLSARQTEITKKLFHPTPDDPEPFGGFSGGPVVVVGTDGEFLLGIIKQGGSLFGSLRIAASCWDDCLNAFKRSLEQGKAARARKRARSRRRTT
jgi:hypothetical protein